MEDAQFCKPEKIRVSTKSMILVALFATGSFFSLKAQKSFADSVVNVAIISAHYKAQLPGGDLSNRFGPNSSIGLATEYKTKSNWNFALGYSFLFGGQVKEVNILDFLRTSNGDLVDQNGQIGQLIMEQRGFEVQLSATRMLIKLGPNPNCGIYLGMGVGGMQHRIKLRELAENFSFLQGDYLKGYDRLSGGFLLTEKIGYQFFANSKFVNFYAEVELEQMFGRGMRSWQSDLRSPYLDPRTDLLNGIRIGWRFPIYSRGADKFYYD